MNNCKSEKTGYASIDRPWSEFYKNIPQNNLFLNTTPYQGLFDNNKNYPTETAIEYFGKKICYGTLFKNIDAAARALVKCGVKKADFVTICSTTTPEVIYTFYAISKIGAVANIISPFYSESDFISRINESKMPVGPFTDVYADSYFSDAVIWAYNNGITTGTSASTFGPGDSCTRGQVVTFLWRAMGKPEPKTSVNKFTDVKENDYFYKAVLWAVENGITDGTSATAFSPNQTCSFAHILTFLWRTMGKPGATGTGNWYDDAYNWASKKGLTENTAAAGLNGNCPRSDVVTFLYRELAK